MNVLNSGSVCAIGPLNDIVRMALFYNLAILSTLSDLPHNNIRRAYEK